MICAMIYALLSSASIWLMVPFLENIFKTSQTTALQQEQPAEERPEQSIQPDFLHRIKTELRTRTDRWVSRGTRENTLQRICLIVLISFFLKNFFGYAQGYLLAHVEQGIIKHFRDQIYEHLHTLSMSYFHRRQTGHLISRVVNDVTLLNEAVNASLIHLLRDPVMVVVYLGILCVLSWKLTLAVLVVLPFGAWFIALIGKKLRKHSLRSQERIADITSVLEETLFGIRVVKAFAMERFEIEKFRKATDRFRRSAPKLRRIRRLASPTTEFMGAAIGVTVIWIGGRQVLLGGRLAPEEFMVFLISMFLMIQPLKSLGNVYSRVKVGVAAGDRIFEVLDTPAEICERKDARTTDTLREEICYRKVSFAYDDEPVLRDINLCVKVGEVLAIVGPSGAGKSTLVDLLPRFYDPTQGAITIDGVDLRDLKIADLRRLMGMVTQETILFNDTVRNNIAYGHPEIEDDQIFSAARAANAHDFIMDFPEGYATMIGDRGVRLSGGQRQRLSIARAILKNPPILIFDEATSSLDSEAEQLVQQAIEHLMQGRTALVIAHRLSTIQNAHRIIVMDEGRIVQEGTHQTLIAQKGLYRKLYRMQFRKDLTRAENRGESDVQNDTSDG
jgi:subfamily B ATP-binding cassette protein MsbA